MICGEGGRLEDNPCATFLSHRLFTLENQFHLVSLLMHLTPQSRMHHRHWRAGLNWTPEKRKILSGKALHRVLAKRGSRWAHHAASAARLLQHSHRTPHPVLLLCLTRVGMYMCFSIGFSKWILARTKHNSASFSAGCTCAGTP